MSLTILSRSGSDFSNRLGPDPNPSPYHIEFVQKSFKDPDLTIKDPDPKSSFPTLN
jgi:hypothetical protein